MKELEDYSWFPGVLRNFQTEYIGFVVTRFNVYDEFIRYLKSLSLPVQDMMDLCSGSGEPAITIFRKSNCFDKLVLSDKYPDVLRYGLEKVYSEILEADVLTFEFKYGTCYTMFNAFHHFGDGHKKQIIQKIQQSGATAFIVEILEPKPSYLLKVLFTTTLGTLLLTPFIKPYSLKRLFFTYIIPVNILTIGFDGIVSVLKSRSFEQYQKLFASDRNSVKVFKLKSRLSSLVVIHVNPLK